MSMFKDFGNMKQQFDKYREEFNNFRQGIGGNIGGNIGASSYQTTSLISRPRPIPGRGVKPREVRKNPFAGLARQKYEDIKAKCLGESILFEDPEFEAEDKSIFFSSAPPRPFEWKRPHVSLHLIFFICLPIAGRHVWVTLVS